MDIWTRGHLYFETRSYDNAIKCFDAYLEQNPDDIKVLHNKGVALLKLGRVEESSQCYAQSKKDILSTFISLGNNDIDKSIEEKKQLAPFLDKMLAQDEFFKTITKDIQEDKLGTYKQIYIKSMLIVSLLYINSTDEEFVSHYSKETLPENLFVEKKPFWLPLVTTSNDPNEGQSLLDYFFSRNDIIGEQIKIIDGEFGAFTASFTFNLDHLNQFRLYGKSSSGIEAGGVSLVVNKSYFNTISPDNSNTHEAVVERHSKEDGHHYDKSNKSFRDMNIEDNGKLSLFRCIYIDTDSGFVASVGQKEEYTFYQDANEKGKLGMYQHKINRILEEVRYQMNELKIDIKHLNPKIVSQLLLSLRYLTKDVSFKEEQECRIITIKPRLKSKIFYDDKKKEEKRYFDYLEMNEYIEKIILGPKCFKEEYQIADDRENEFRDTMKNAGIKEVVSSKWQFK